MDSRGEPPARDGPYGSVAVSGEAGHRDATGSSGVSLFLAGLGHFHPENEITNAFLESLDIGTSEDWILERVGIRSRRTALPLDYIRETKNRDPARAIEVAEYSQAQMGARAARVALERAGVDAQQVGLVIGGGCAPDTVTPADACNLARELGLTVPALDMNSACTSFYAGIHMLSMMDPDRLPDYVLLVSMEGMTRTVDFSDRSSAVLWGDAAVAAVITTRHGGRAELLGSTLETDPQGTDKVIVPRLGHFDQEGRTVQMFAIKKTSRCYTALSEIYSEDDRTLHFIGHQANLRMLENVCKRCDIAPEHHHSNAEWFGNTGAASGASVLSQNWDKWKKDDDVAMVGVGAGLTWGSYLVRFREDA